MQNDNDLTPLNSVLTLIDHQPFVAFSVKSIDMTSLLNNTTGLAKMAKVLNIPTILTMITPPGSQLLDPIFESITDVFPEQKPVERVNTNAWSDEKFVQAIKATKRKKIIMAGRWTEVCLQQTAISAIKDGFDVYFVSDASGGLSSESHADAKQRMIQAGAKPTNWFSCLCELSPDYSSPDYRKLYPAALEHGGAPSVASQYLMAQMNRH